MLASLLALFPILAHGAVYDFDLVVYGASPAGIAAAITAANNTNLRVALLEPSPYVGGMSGPGGIGLRDTAEPAAAVTGGPRSVMATWLAASTSRYPGTPQTVRQPDANISMELWDALVASPAYRLTVVRNAALDESPGAVVRVGSAIQSIRVCDPREPQPPASTDTYTARFFIDATYEADVVMASGASFTVGREPAAQYNESIGGVIPTPAFQHFRPTVNPFWPNGTLLDGIEDSNLMPPKGGGDDRVMPSSYRACITDDPELRVPWPRPEGYNEGTYELLLRLAEGLGDAATFKDYVGVYPYYGYPATPTRPMKYDLCENSELSTDQPSHIYTDYVFGNRSVREGIRAKVRDWVAGWAYTLANHPRVPPSTRASVSNFGLCKDAFTTSGHWPLQMYVREGVRLVGDRVATQVNTVTGECVPTAIALGAWSIDIHLMRRFNGTRGGNASTENEGEVGFQGFPGEGTVYELPLTAILPKRQDVTNLLAPVTPSASHVAFGSMRVEPIFMALGTAAGAAVALAVETHTAIVHDVDISALQAKLTGVDQCFHWDVVGKKCALSCPAK